MFNFFKNLLKPNSIISKPCKHLFKGKSIVGYSKKSSQDAYFISGNSFGVCDGVGGWLVEGIDSGVYSRILCRELCRNLSLYKGDIEDINLKSIVEESNQFLKTHHILGSTTSCIGYLDGSSMKVYNIGDSGMIIISPEGNSYKIEAKTDIQTHFFNCPYQLGDDDPLLGDVYSFNLKPGSVIIAATDGIFDNLFNENILSHVKNHLLPTKQYYEQDLSLILEKLVDSIIIDSFKKSIDIETFTPFQSECQKNSQQWSGGKPDDMTLIVGMVY